MKLRPFLLSATLILLSSICLTSVGEDEKKAANVQPLRMKLIGANPSAKRMPLSDLPTESYFFGQDTSAGDAATHAKAWYKDIYPGVDLVAFGDDMQLEYVFVTQPGADPSPLMLSFEDTSIIDIQKTGEAVYDFASARVQQSKPVTMFTHGGVTTLADGSANMFAGDSAIALSPSTTFEDNVSNRQFLQFLNDTQASPKSQRGKNMHFDKHGNVWMNPEHKKDNHEMFILEGSQIIYDPSMPAGSRYKCQPSYDGSDYFMDRPVSGVSFFGAAKFSNWLTMVSGRDRGKLGYTEGTNPEDWTPQPDKKVMRGTFLAKSIDDQSPFRASYSQPPDAQIEIHIIFTFHTKPEELQGSGAGTFDKLGGGSSRGGGADTATSLAQGTSKTGSQPKWSDTDRAFFTWKNTLPDAADWSDAVPAGREWADAANLQSVWSDTDDAIANADLLALGQSKESDSDGIDEAPPKDSGDITLQSEDERKKREGPPGIAINIESPDDIGDDFNDPSMPDSVITKPDDGSDDQGEDQDDDTPATDGGGGGGGGAGLLL